jgi:uncharacterized membrane protein YbhN (UPF0104 family)
VLAPLEHVRPRTLITLIAGLAAAYILVGQLSKVSLHAILARADWRWSLVAVLLSLLTYAGAELQLAGCVLERLDPVRTFLAQIAASFTLLVTPAAVGGAGLNLRYLYKAKVRPADAAASIGLSQAAAFVLHVFLLLIFAALTRMAGTTSLLPPGWVWIALAVVTAVMFAMAAFPAGRGFLRARLAPAFGQVIPRLRAVACRPAKLAEGVGGALLVTFAYIFCLAACVLALGGSLALPSVAVVYLTSSAIASAVPTPGGLGTTEAALSAGLAAAGMPGVQAVSAALLFRLVTFWLPVPVGWLALNYLQRKDAL